MVSYEQMQLEYAKSYMDKSRIYFIERYLKTFNATEGKNVAFQLFPRQKVFLRNIAENNNNIAIKHRQCGITTVSSAFSAAQCVFAAPDAPETILCIGNKLDLAQQLIIKIREFLTQIPRWFWGDDFYSPDPKSEKNKRDIFIKNSKSELELFNGCKVYARSSGVNAARGISAVSILIFDEAAFIEDGIAVYSSAVAATASNPNRKIIMVSTPNGKDELYYNTYKQAIAKENGYIATEFKWFQDLRYNRNLSWYKKDEKTGELIWDVDEVIDAKGNIRYDEERWIKLEQSGWKPSSPWYISMCQSFNNDTQKIAQELDVSFEGSANNVVSQEFIDIQNTYNVRKPLDDFKDPLIEETWFWKEPIPGHRYICACLPEGEQVLTQRGLVNVEDVQSDDLLVTKEGEFTKIKHRKYRNVEDEDIVEIKASGIMEPFKFTHNHPIWSSINSDYRAFRENGKKIRKYIHQFDYHDANNLNTEAWLEMPNIYNINEMSLAELQNHWEKYDKLYVNNSKITNPLLNEEFWWFCGMWLAEGYIHHGMIITCHHQKETEYLDKVMNFAKSLNRNPMIKKYPDSLGVKIIFGCKQIVQFIDDNFGHYAHSKYIAEWIKYIPSNFKRQLIKGYLDGDGCYAKNQIAAVTVSKSLISSLQDILLSLGISCSVSVKYESHNELWADSRIVHKKTAYLLLINATAAHKLLNEFKEGLLYERKKKVLNTQMYFSNDGKKIFLKIKNISKYKYSGKVYNFETENESHSFCCRAIASHNCDPSRGISEDNTAIEIIDMDGRDENGMPIIEQVAEYLGKQLGDDIGGMIYQYATMYNNAHVIIDCTGGSGDAAILTLLNMGYKNLYYDDAIQKTYTIQNRSKQLGLQYQDKLPGFHFQGNRFPVLSNFAGMVRNNEFKIRSVRVINELETWIFKGDTGRMDHMDGSHDDTLTSLAMGLFVMRFSLNKMQEIKNKDKAILDAYRVNSSINRTPAYSTSQRSIDIRGNGSSPLIRTTRVNQYGDIGGSFMWLFGQ